MALLSISGIGRYLLSDEINFRSIKAGKLHIEIVLAPKRPLPQCQTDTNSKYHKE